MKTVSTSRNVLFGFLGWLLPLACTFALTPYIVHGLGADAYGLYTLVIGVMGYLASLNFNVGRSITKYVAAGQVHARTGEIGEILSASIILHSLIAVLSAGSVVLLADWLVIRVLQIPAEFQSHARLALYVGSAGVIFTLFSQLFGAVPQALQRFDIYGFVTIGSGIAAICGNGLMVWLGFRFPALVAWNVVVGMFACLAYAVSFRQLLPDVRLTFRIRKNLLRDLLRFSGAVTVYMVAGNIFVLLERGWVTRSLGAAAVTYYVVPMTIAIYIHAFISSLTLVVFPMASEANARGDRAHLNAVYTRAMKYIIVVVLLVAVVLGVGSREFLSNWMGSEFAGRATAVLKVHVVSFSILAMLVVPWQIADGSGFPGGNAVVSLLWLGIAVPAAALLTSRMGILGVACARMAAMATVPFYIVYVERRIFGKFQWSFWGRVAVPLAVAGASGALLLSSMLEWMTGGWLWFAVSAGMTGIMMTGILWATGYVDGNEKEWIRQLVSHSL